MSFFYFIFYCTTLKASTTILQFFDAGFFIPLTTILIVCLPGSKPVLVNSSKSGQAPSLSGFIQRLVLFSAWSCSARWVAARTQRNTKENQTKHTMSVLTAFLRAIGQLHDPRFLRVVLHATMTPAEMAYRLILWLLIGPAANRRPRLAILHLVGEIYRKNRPVSFAILRPETTKSTWE